MSHLLNEKNKNLEIKKLDEDSFKEEHLSELLLINKVLYQK